MTDLDEKIYLSEKDKEYVIENIRNQFQIGFPEERVVSYRVLSFDDLLVVLDNGHAIIFSTRTHASRPLGPINSKSERQLKRMFGVLLRTQMEAHFVSQGELASRLNTSQPVISRYVNGEDVPGYFMLKQIADAIRCPVEYLYLPISYSREKHRLL